MKIQIASDLHLERMGRFAGYRAVEPSDADVLVIAGDIHNGIGAIDAFADWPVPAIYLHGNHEAYDAQYPMVVEDILRHALAGNGNVTHLENDARIINGVRFLGCCPWTDYGLQQDGVAALTLEGPWKKPARSCTTIVSSACRTASSGRSMRCNCIGNHAAGWSSNWRRTSTARRW